MDDKAIREIYINLAAPFPEEAIQRTKGIVTKRGYDTTGIAYQFVVNRLNEVAGLQGWNYTYEIVKELEGSYQSGGQFYDLTLEVSMWVGDPEIVRKAPGGHRAASYADALKGALTNGLKKVAAMFGVGRQAYEGTLDDDNLPHSSSEGTGDLKEMPKSPSTINPAAAKSDIVSQKQIQFFIMTCNENGVTADQAKAYLLKTFNIDSRKGIPHGKFEEVLAWVRAQKPQATKADVDADGYPLGDEPGSQG